MTGHMETMIVRRARLVHVRSRNRTLIRLDLTTGDHDVFGGVTAWHDPNDLPRLLTLLDAPVKGEYADLTCLEGARVRARYTSIVGRLTGIAPINGNDDSFIETAV